MNDLDFVPDLPPRDLIEGYEHVNSELKFIDSNGEIGGDMTPQRRIESGVADILMATRDAALAVSPTAVLGRLLGMDAVDAPDLAGRLGVDIVPFPPLADHAPINYATRVRNALVRDQPRDGNRYGLSLTSDLLRTGGGCAILRSTDGKAAASHRRALDAPFAASEDPPIRRAIVKCR